MDRKGGSGERERESRCVFLSSSNRLGEEGQQSVMQQSCGREKKETIKKKKRKRKEMATRGSEGVRREVADSKRKISRRGS